MTNAPTSALSGFFAATPAAASVPTLVAATAIAATTTFDFAALALPLLAHQEEAVARIHADVARFGGSYVGDEMGLGKTFAAIAAVALAPTTYPALVVCPPSLTLNWRNEIVRLVPGARVVVLSGTKPVLPAPADFYVIGDAVLAKWAGLVKVTDERTGKSRDVVNGVLVAMGIRALVVDEAHRFKSYKAQRARAAMAFAATLPTGALRVLMSGTAIVNRPSELATQLRIAGVDHVFGGWWSFLNRYCPVLDRWGTRGSAFLSELHETMVSTFYLRRLRSEVLTLPGKGRISVGTAMTGPAARDYVRAQDDLIAYVRGERGDKAAESAGKAEALVLLNTLRRLIGAAKVAAVIDYVQGLLDEGEQVFVAATHKSTIAALKEAFGAVTITGDDTTQAKQGAVEAFQSGQARVLAGNIAAAGVGFTLTAARHIVVAELPWTPGDLQQVEDRLDRIGQTREVVSHLMLGTNGVATVDERLMSILNDKAAVTGTVLDGTATSILDDDSIAAALLDSYREG